MNMKIKSLLILALVSVCTFVQAQLTDYSIFDKKFNFYVANDLGRILRPKANSRINGYDGRRDRS